MNFYDYLDSPIGILEIQASKSGITSLVFSLLKDSSPPVVKPSPIIDTCKQQLGEYFQGQREYFTVPLDTIGTQFQQSVWHYLLTIPYGKTTCYQEVASAINHSKAARAVGAANAKNPIAIIVPCHRVVGKNTSLTGYAWGKSRKLWLLEHEAENKNHNKPT